MGEILNLNGSGTKKGLRRLVKSFEHFVKYDKRYRLVSVSDYTKIKKLPWLCRVTIKIEDKSSVNQPRARPGIIAET